MRNREMYAYRTPILCLCACLLHVAATVPGTPDQPLMRYEFQSPHMGTQFRIVLYTSDEATATAASHAAFDRIRQLDETLSDYNADSELMRLCARAGGPPVPVSEDLFFVLAQSQELAQQSDGAFDVSVGPVVRLWRRARRQHKLPDPERLAQARQLVGFQYIRLEKNARTVQLAKPRMQLDLGGIAKGYAADQAMVVIKRHGIKRALVAASGDIVVGEPPPGEPGWTIAVGAPGESAKQPLDYLLLHNAAVSTSGDAEQFLEIDGKRYSHVIDPRNGQALTDRLQVTVVAPDGTASDGLATMLSVMGPEHGMKLIEAAHDAAALVVRSGPSDTATFKSARYDRIPKGRPKSTESLNK
jgi:thiamine biosynthesis lipoprotein